ncbi:hypothetical protein H696_00804 [Fonticula alba]|uniref:Uncharacterized protein n=1 Tax=Fonticula alba TaxID=691883 RepID=A0A058ZIB4_FONAL|nr:hypothetical protein H696_00804 [Fonticula alba]KCV73262.1 hypothetical protein H696_00804 [Fonticula alba]|eukprot:XP_009492963.1 hypothetical protein H696_00804 [Fonticula alba]
MLRSLVPHLGRATGPLPAAPLAATATFPQRNYSSKKRKTPKPRVVVPAHQARSTMPDLPVGSTAIPQTFFEHHSDPLPVQTPDSAFPSTKARFMDFLKRSAVSTVASYSIAYATTAALLYGAQKAHLPVESLYIGMVEIGLLDPKLVSATSTPGELVLLVNDRLFPVHLGFMAFAVPRINLRLYYRNSFGLGGGGDAPPTM